MDMILYNVREGAGVNTTPGQSLGQGGASNEKGKIEKDIVGSRESKEGGMYCLQVEVAECLQFKLWEMTKLGKGTRQGEQAL